jgi:hypothetical protein
MQRRDVGVDRGVGQRQTLGIARHPDRARDDAAVQRAIAPRRQHLLIYVDDDDARPPAAQISHGDVAGPAADIEKGVAGARAQPAHQLRLPQPMDAAAHQIVHEIVAGRHAVEDALHAAAMLLRRHLFVAEIPGFAAVVSGAGHGRDHSGSGGKRL